MIFDKTLQDAPRLYWSADDIKLIKRRYGKKPLAEIAATLGRSEGAVRAQAFRLGLKGQARPDVTPKIPPDIKPVRHRSPWTTKELNYVQAHYGKTPTREIAAKLARMQSAINMAAQALGLCSKQAQKWSQEEMAVLRTHYAEGAGVSCVLALLPGRSKSSIVVKASELGIHCAYNWHPDEERILREFYPLMGTRVVEKLPRRSSDAVRNKAWLLGLRYHKLKDPLTSFKPRSSV